MRQFETIYRYLVRLKAGNGKIYKLHQEISPSATHRHKQDVRLHNVRYLAGPHRKHSTIDCMQYRRYPTNRPSAIFRGAGGDTILHTVQDPEVQALPGRPRHSLHLAGDDGPFRPGRHTISTWYLYLRLVTAYLGRIA